MTITNTLKLLSVAAALTVGFTGCDVDVEDEGSLPSVDVEGGEMPEVDVETPEVDVETAPLEVPTDVDVDIPEDN